MPGIGIISNPFAKVNKRDPHHNTLLWYILGNKGQYEVTESISDLSRVCKEFESRGIDHIGIVGGDGTISLTLSAIFEAYTTSDPGRAHALPKILLLRGGTVNVAASNLGIYGKPKSVMHDFLDAYHSGKELSAMKVSTLKVNDRLGFLFANGMAARFLQEFYKNKSNALGAGLYFSRVFSDLLLGGHLSGDIDKLSAFEDLKLSETDPQGKNQTHEGGHSMIFASTLPAMPFGFKMFKKLRVGQSEAEMVAFTARAQSMLPLAARVLTGRTLKGQGFRDTLFSKVHVESKESLTFSLDGDVMMANNGKIDLSVGPTFEFCSPYGKVL